MRAIKISTLSAGLDQLATTDVPEPEPKAGEVQVRIEAAGVNFPDLLMCQGKYQHRPSLPFTPGMEFAGVITKLGEGVNGFKEGMEVMGGSQTGAFAQSLCVAANACQPKPQAFSMAQAASFSVAALTARVALFRRGQLQAGEYLLVLGAGGGVGLAAVALGHEMGAKVIALASSKPKRALAQAKGASLCLAPDENWREQVMEHTKGKGVDAVYDPVGGAAFKEAVRCVGWGGRYLIIGFAAGEIPSLPINYPLIKGFSLVGVRAGESSRRNPAQGEEDRAWLHALAEQGKLRPHIGASFPLDQTRQALEALAARKALGKLVILPQA